MRCELAFVAMLLAAHLGTVPALFGQAADGPTTDSADRYIKAWATNLTDNDPEKMTAFYENSEETEVIVSSGALLRGYDAIRQSYDDAQREVRFVKSATKNLRSRIVGDLALVTFEHLFETHHLADGSRWQGHVRTTAILKRTASDWTIILEHSSPIRGIERLRRVDD